MRQVPTGAVSPTGGQMLQHDHRREQWGGNVHAVIAVAL